MSTERNRFIEFCINHEILRFGEFTLKSGRISPYFFNAGLFHNGRLAKELAIQYATLINAKFDDSVMLYGPAYKGIPLAATTALQLEQHFNKNVSFCFNRKEKKDHGEGGQLVGAPLSGDVIILDDVITAGTSIHESVEIIRAQGATAKAVVVAIDREEVASGKTYSAKQEILEQYNMPVYGILTMSDLITYIEQANDQQINSTTRQQMHEYREQYGEPK